MYRFSCLVHCIATVNHDSSELRHKGERKRGRQTRKREGGFMNQGQWNKFTAVGTKSLKRASASSRGALPTCSTMQLGPLTLPNLKQFLNADLPVCSRPPGKMRSITMNSFLRFLIHVKVTRTYMTVCSEVLLLTGIFSFTEMFKCSRVFNDVL